MSIKIMSQVTDYSPSKNGERLVLLAIANYANDDARQAWPSVSSLARWANLSERATRDALRALEMRGEIETEIGAGREGSNLYTVVVYPLRAQTVNSTQGRGAEFAGGQNSPPADIAPGQNSQGGSLRHKGGQNSPPGGAVCDTEGGEFCPQSVIEPSSEPSINRQGDTGSDEPAAPPSGTSADLPDKPPKPKTDRDKADKAKALFQAFRSVRYPGLSPNPTHNDLRSFSKAINAAVKDERTPEQMRIATAVQIEERQGTGYDVTPESVLKYFDSLLEKANGNANRTNNTNSANSSARTDYSAAERAPNGRGTAGMDGAAQSRSPNGGHGNGQRRSAYPQAGEV